MLMYEFNGEKLKKLRDESGLSQGQIAKYLNVDQSYISRYEKNERQLSATMLEKISNLFGCPIEYFVTENFDYKPLPFALRASSIDVEDLEAISAINKIALNLRNMDNLLKGE